MGVTIPVVDGMRTRGHPVALVAVRSMLGGDVPHAVLLSGPGRVGKTTLARDLASGLLCVAAQREERPCGACRGCRMVRSGNHPDVHVLAPEGAGGQIRIGDRTNPEPGTVRRLVTDLSLLPVEGGARVAIIEQADRMNEEAQSALLKTLEEPSDGITLVLCADQEERLLPTVRSRCARIRLGTVAVREIEALLQERGTDPPLGARLARLSGGRPGIAFAYVAAPQAVIARGEVSRTLLDLIGAGRAERLAAIGGLLSAAAKIGIALRDDPNGTSAAGKRGAVPASRSRGRPRPDEVEDAPNPPEAGASPDDATGSSSRVPVAERRRAAIVLLEIWRDVTRDLAVTGLGSPAALHDPGLLEDLREAAARVPPDEAARFLERLAKAGELLEGNVSPELTMDSLVLAWPRRSAAA
jgi:DNA polymerase III subunit delta'